MKGVREGSRNTFTQTFFAYVVPRPIINNAHSNTWLCRQ